MRTILLYLFIWSYQFWEIQPEDWWTEEQKEQNDIYV